jgi:hypothetical protein
MKGVGIIQFMGSIVRLWVFEEVYMVWRFVFKLGINEIKTFLVSEATLHLERFYEQKTVNPELY